MSAVENSREVAYRLFAAEFDDATLSYSEGDEERAPNYVVTPTGARVNRLFAVGALTEVESVNEEVLRGRIADPTGVFVTYAGQYQPEATNFLDRATPPMFVSLTGKARTYEPDDSDRVFTSVRPESVNEVDAATRDRWVVSAARDTLERVATMRAALAMDRRGDDLRVALEARGVDESLAAGVPLAIDHYGTTEHYLEAVRTLAVQALELVAGERDAVDSLTVAPDETGPDGLGPVPDVPAATPPEGGDVAVTEARADDEGASGLGDDTATAGDAATDDATAGDAESDGERSTGVGASADAGADATTETAAEAESTAETESTATTETTTDVEADSETTTEAETMAAEMAEAETTDSEPTPGRESSEPTETDEEPETGASAGGLDDFDAGESVGDAEPTGMAEMAETEAGEGPASGEESAADDEPASSGGLGDFSTDDEDADADANAAESAATTGEMYEMDDDERAEIEEEFGAEFSTGNEVDDPGEADIDVPDSDEVEARATEAAAETNGEATDAASEAAASDAGETAAGEAADAAPGTTADADADAADTDAAGETGGDATEPAEDVDLEGAVVDVMADLDDGDGADRESVVDELVDRYGADPGDVDDAIQDALMSGKCYEPNEGTLKSI